MLLLLLLLLLQQLEGTKTISSCLQTFSSWFLAKYLHYSSSQFHERKKKTHQTCLPLLFFVSLRILRPRIFGTRISSHLDTHKELYFRKGNIKGTSFLLFSFTDSLKEMMVSFCNANPALSVPNWRVLWSPLILFLSLISRKLQVHQCRSSIL